MAPHVNGRVAYPGDVEDEENPRSFFARHRLLLSAIATGASALLAWGWAAAKYDSRLVSVESQVNDARIERAREHSEFRQMIHNYEAKTATEVERINHRIQRVEKGVVSTCTGIKILLGPDASAIQCETEGQ